MHLQHLETLFAHSGLSTMHSRHFESKSSVAYLGLSAMCNRIADDDVTCHMRLGSLVLYMVSQQIDAKRCSFVFSSLFLNETGFACRRRNKKVSNVECQAFWQEAKASGCNLSEQLCEYSCNLNTACLGFSRDA